MLTDSRCDEQRISHHVHHHGNEKKATDSAVQNQVQNYFSDQKVDCQNPKENKLNDNHKRQGVYQNIKSKIQSWGLKSKMEFNPFRNSFSETVYLQMVCCFVFDNSTTSLGYQEQKTFSSSHLSSLTNVLKDNLVEWFEPEIWF